MLHGFGRRHDRSLQKGGRPAFPRRRVASGYHLKRIGMVPLWSLPTLAALFALCAAGVAGLRRLGMKRALGDTAVATWAAAMSITPTVSFLAVAARSSDGAVWRSAGTLCFVAFPVLSAVALSLRAQKRDWRKGSLLGTLLGSCLAVAVVGTWVTVYLKGVRGGWTPIEILVCLASVWVVFTASACLGWWCDRIMRYTNA